ncbi:MAG: FKBP-type peptidyl-prolyl cis-trans isomerase [Candidatus Altiarchaeota archaeon]
MATEEKTNSAKRKARKKEEKAVELSYRGIALILVVLLIVVIGLSYRDRLLPSDNGAPTPAVVEYGDNVTMNYVLMFTNGTIFDTSYENVSREAGIYNEERVYQPLAFTVGARTLITGVELAVLGMKEGDEKIVNIPPEQGYGPYDEKNVQVMNRTYQLSRIDIIPLSDFENTVIADPEPNQTYESINVPWPMKIIEVTNESVLLEYEPDVNSIITTMLGNATVVEVTADSITLRENPVKDWGVLTRFGLAKILDFDDEYVYLDFNHPLAGKTLVFSIRVESIQKGAGQLPVA